MNNKTKKIILITSLLLSVILVILLNFNNIAGINLSTNYKIFLKSALILLILLSLIISILIKTKKEIEEVIKEKIIYKDIEPEKNKKNDEQNKDFDYTVNNIVNDILKDSNKKITEQLISKICKKFELCQAIAYSKNNDIFVPIAKYAYFADEEPKSFKEGDGMLGQTVKNKKQFILTDIPDGYIEIISGLGKGKPKEILMQPIILNNENVTGIIEFASFKNFSNTEKQVINEIAKKIKN